jgi:hypothetical protein
VSKILTAMRVQAVTTGSPARGIGGAAGPAGISSTTIAVLNCFLVLGLLGLYLKFALMGDQWGAVARFLGKLRPEHLILAERLGFFADDVVVNLLIVPVAATLVITFLCGSYRLVAALGLSLLMSVCYFIELRAQDALGQYVSRVMLRDMVGWAVANPSVVRDYVTTASLIKLAGLIATLLTIVVIARLAQRAEAEQSASSARRYRLMLRLPAAVVLVAAMLCAPICYACRASNSPLNDSSVGRAAALLVGNGERAAVAATTQTFDQALAAARRLTATPPFDRANPLVGREGGSDVIVFVMETGAAQALDVGRNLPGAGPLYDQSFVTQRHYTSHPYSSDALYSVLSGMYPQGRRRLVRRATAGSLNGLMSAVASGFPTRRVYIPSLYQLELDDRMYEAFGAERVFVSDQHGADPLRSVAERRADNLITTRLSVSRLSERSRAVLRNRLVADFQAMEQMKSDIAAAINAGQRYCVVFFPEIGHGPWLDLHENESVRARGRALMLLQDTWLKEIVDQVRGAGRLQRTIIALTGDHGVRTRAEDPALKPGTLSDYTFRVPLLIYAPQTLSHTVVVSEPTSHIDLAPTILGLLGAVEPAGRMQGVPIWQRAATNRLYLLAFAYGGADGFVQDGTYYMRQALSGAVSKSRDFSFADDEHVGPDDPAIPLVNGALEDLDALQRVLVARQGERLR